MAEVNKSSNTKLLVIILTLLMWLPGLIVCACMKKDMSQSDYLTCRTVIVVLGFIMFIIPGVIALVVLHK
jgi:uncharacterized membrane protein YidH (DUF202 family)